MNAFPGTIADLNSASFLLNNSLRSPAPDTDKNIDLQCAREKFIHETEVFLEIQLSSDNSAFRWPQRFSQLSL